MSALLRLLWRPAWLLFVGLLLFMALGSLIVVVVLAVLAPGTGEIQWSEHRWPLVSLGWLVAGMLGFAVGIARLQLQHAPFSWGLPDLRRRLMAGTLVLGLAVSAPALLVPGLGPLEALAAFALTLFVFVLAGSVAEVVGRSQWAFVALVFASLFVSRPGLDWVAAVPPQWHSAAAIVTLAGAGLLLVHQFSVRVARARYGRWSMFASDFGTAYWKRKRTHARRWTRSLATDRLIPWLRAVEWEGLGGSGGYRLVPVFVGEGVFAGVFVHVFNEPAMVFWVVGIFFVLAGFQLGSALPYPVSRARRSRVAAWGATLQLVLIGGTMGVTIAGAGALGVPVFHEEQLWGLAMGPALGTAMALAPLAQWAPIRWGDPMVGGRDPHVMARLGVAFGYIIVAHLAARAVMSAPPLVTIGAITVAAMLLQIAFHAAVRRHYARADLVSTEPAIPEFPHMRPQS